MFLSGGPTAMRRVICPARFEQQTVRPTAIAKKGRLWIALYMCDLPGFLPNDVPGHRGGRGDERLKTYSKHNNPPRRSLDGRPEHPQHKSSKNDQPVLSAAPVFEQTPRTYRQITPLPSNCSPPRRSLGPWTDAPNILFTCLTHTHTSRGARLGWCSRTGR